MEVLVTKLFNSLTKLLSYIHSQYVSLTPVREINVWHCISGWRSLNSRPLSKAKQIHRECILIYDNLQYKNTHTVCTYVMTFKRVSFVNHIQFPVWSDRIKGMPYFKKRNKSAFLFRLNDLEKKLIGFNYAWHNAWRT